MNLINMVLKILVKNFQKKRKRRGITKNKTTKTGHQNHINPGPGTITYTPSQNNTLIEALLKKDDKVLPLIAKLIKGLNRPQVTTEETLNNAQIVKYLNEGDYDKLIRFYPQVEGSLNKLKRITYDTNERYEETKQNLENLDLFKRDLENQLIDSQEELNRLYNQRKINEFQLNNYNKKIAKYKEELTANELQVF